ncbi:MAG TPA: histidinol dehydrogenase [Candidatus Dormibacteraeota bacterium]|jgi:histidinol dehydrogenase|nr:histidinol dehydrogenase [Candidatus Dormibacteraeota bacterium]
MSLTRFDADGWRRSPLSRRRLDAGGTDEQVASVRAICRRVAEEGDAALLHYSAEFDTWAPPDAGALRVPAGRAARAHAELPAAEREALELAAERIRTFHRAQVFADVAGPEGLTLRTRPVRRVGLYAPGGRAAYPSTVLMAAIPARLAGVSRIALATPPNERGELPQAVLAAAHVAGVDEIYRMGGAQAIAALAYGTESIPRVDIIAGPGNIYVTLAKREVFGAVGVDGIAGPTEILVVADGTADAVEVAADLVSQMEHDPMAWAVLVTDSPGLADAVAEAFDDMVPRLERSAVIAAAHCCVVLTSSLAEAVDLANDFAPEHLELVGEGAEALLDRVENAGAIFVGRDTPVSLGDYVIGPNHTLPTAQAARFSSPLGVYTFLKRSSVAHLGAEEFQALQGAARTLAGVEGLGAHAHALEVRCERRR